MASNGIRDKVAIERDGETADEAPEIESGRLAALLDVMSRELAGAAAARLSARFSLMDLPAFLDAAWRA